MSILARLLKRLFRPSHLVGSDFAGNRFYEHPSLFDGTGRTRRTIKYRNAADMWDYIGGGKRLPIQWAAWLSHTRRDPPTLEELRLDLARQRRVLQSAALIEARDREERNSILRLNPGVSKGDVQLEQPLDVIEPDPTRLTHSEASSGQLPLGQAMPEQVPKKTTSSDLPRQAAEPEYQPEAWIPQTCSRASRRGTV